jgi:hypothetical protein
MCLLNEKEFLKATIDPRTLAYYTPCVDNIYLPLEFLL